MEPRRPLPPVPPAVVLTAAELQQYVGVYRGPQSADDVRIAIVDGKLAERLIDTVQTMTPRGNGQFTGDGSPGDFRHAGCWRRHDAGVPGRRRSRRRSGTTR